jgi:hypothetical protein
MATSNGCQSAFSNEIAITVNQIPNVIINVPVNSFCANDSVTLSVNDVNGRRYQWMFNEEQIPGATVSEFIARKGGKYAVTETDNGCSSTSSTITLTTQPAPPKPTITFAAQNLRSSALTGNQWYKNGVAIAGASFQQYTPTSNGNYTVQVTKDGCQSMMSSVYPFVITGIITIDDVHFIKLGPNPVANEVTLNFDIVNMYRLNMELYDLNGKLIRNWRNLKDGSKVDLSAYPGSLYLARLYSDNGKINVTFKLVKH